MYIQSNAYDIKEFIVDTEDDLESFEIENLKMGTVCFVIETSDYYMLNSKKEWIQVELFAKRTEGREV